MALRGGVRRIPELDAKVTSSMTSSAPFRQPAPYTTDLLVVDTSPAGRLLMTVPEAIEQMHQGRHRPPVRGCPIAAPLGQIRCNRLKSLWQPSGQSTPYGHPTTRADTCPKVDPPLRALAEPGAAPYPCLHRHQRRREGPQHPPGYSVPPLKPSR